MATHPDAPPFLEVESLGLDLGSFSLKDVDISCRKGEYHILLGPSGSGKSTLLKSLLGFHRLRSGRIRLDGREITRELPERRRIGYVPQNYALFPHLNVEGNLRFGLRARRNTLAHEADALVNQLCGMLRIDALRSRRVQNLSGGERQKVALGRALCTRPEIILLDEPFSSIDEGGRRRLWFELKQSVAEIGITVLHVTHNLDEAYTLGERLSVLIDGDLVQSGPKREIFERPATEGIARYLNYRNLLTGISREEAGGTRVELEHFTVVVGRRLPPGRPVRLCVRAQDIKIVREGVPLRESLKRNVFAGEIVELFPLPEACLMWFRVDGSGREFDLEVRFPLHIVQRHGLHAGKRVRVAFLEPTIIVFDSDSPKV